MLSASEDNAAVSLRRSRVAAYIALGIVVGVLVYLPALQSFFHADDFVLLETVRQGGYAALWTHAPSGFLRPVVSLTLWAEWQQHGLSPFGYHLTNVFLHLANAGGTALIAALLLYDKADNVRRAPLSVMAGFVFLLQPFHAESVAWVSGRTDLIATFFCLASFACHLRFRQGSNMGWFIAALLLAGVALFAKESAFALPLMVLAYEMYCFWAHHTEKARIKRINGRAVLIFLVLLPIYLLLRRMLLGVWVGGYAGTTSPLHLTVKGVCFAACWFTSAGFLPVLPRASAYLLVSALVLAGVAYRWRRGRHGPPTLLVFLLAGFMVTVLPAFTLATGSPAPDGSSGRLAYLPSTFAAIITGLLFEYLFPDRRVYRACAVALLCVFGVQLVRLNVRWRAAGELNRRVVASAIAAIHEAAGAEPVIVLAAPDSLYPALCLRNGLPEAVRLFWTDTHYPPPAVVVAATVFLYAPEDDLRTNYHQGVWAMTPEYTTFRHGYPVWMRSGESLLYTLEEKGEFTMEVKKTGNPQVQLLTYKQGTLIPVGTFP